MALRRLSPAMLAAGSSDGRWVKNGPFRSSDGLSSVCVDGRRVWGVDQVEEGSEGGAYDGAGDSGGRTRGREPLESEAFIGVEVARSVSYPSSSSLFAEWAERRALAAAATARARGGTGSEELLVEPMDESPLCPEAPPPRIVAFLSVLLSPEEGRSGILAMLPLA